MRAKEIFEFTRGGDPYGKLGIGKFRDPELNEIRDNILSNLGKMIDNINNNDHIDPEFFNKIDELVTKAAEASEYEQHLTEKDAQKKVNLLYEFINKYGVVFEDEDADGNWIEGYSIADISSVQVPQDIIDIANNIDNIMARSNFGWDFNFDRLDNEWRVVWGDDI